VIWGTAIESLLGIGDKREVAPRPNGEWGEWGVGERISGEEGVEERWVNLWDRGVDGGSVALICSMEGRVCRTAKRARSMNRISCE